MLKSAAALAAKVVAVAVEDEDDPENKFPIKGGSGRRERNALASGIQFEPAFVESSSSSSSFVVVVLKAVLEESRETTTRTKRGKWASS
mmetsp:Transcript_8097/g.25564  ORF Transcript_8097/g.25564 Transcript_8097/m.25564 type:complete len:89 (+) Transcript_8097:4773-5039(+)